MLQRVRSPVLVAGPALASGLPGGRLGLGWGAVGVPGLAATPAIAQACQLFPCPFLMFPNPGPALTAHSGAQGSASRP